MKDWIMELCPEIAKWQAELIAEEAQKRVLAEREACAQMVEDLNDIGHSYGLENRIRARGNNE